MVSTEAAVEARADELIELFGLQRFADKFVSELSTGTRRLVDLAAVVAHAPTVVLLDEPSSGVAQREVEAMGELLRQGAARAWGRPWWWSSTTSPSWPNWPTAWWPSTWAWCWPRVNRRSCWLGPR